MKKSFPIEVRAGPGRQSTRSNLFYAVFLALFSLSSLLGHAAVLVIDTFDTPEGFSQNTIVSIGLGPLVSTEVTGLPLHETVGGNRYYEVDRVVPAVNSGESVRAETESAFGFSQFRYISSDGARGQGMLSYGRNQDLNADLDAGGLIFGLNLANFSADASALVGNTATMTVTIYSDTGSGSVTKLFSELVVSSSYRWDEFNPGDNINFANVTRIDLSWGNFSATGADFSFSIFGTLNGMPEPGTAALLFLALGLIMLVRRQHTPTLMAVRAVALHNPYFSAPSSSDIYG